MEGSERRKFKRMGANFDITCVKVGPLTQQFLSGCTVNLSQGGLYFKTAEDAYRSGDLLKIQLSIPPTHGLLEFGGKMEGFVSVLRTENIFNSNGYSNELSQKYGVAVEFCRPLTLYS